MNRSSHLVTLSFACLLAACATGVQSPSSPGKPATEPAPKMPKIQIQPAASVQVLRGEVAKGNLVLGNLGDGPLAIHRVSTKPAGLTTHFDSTIAPGATGGVEWSLETMDLLGPVNLSFVVESSDPEQPAASAVVPLEVKTMLRAVPGYARYSLVRFEADGTIGQTVWAEDMDDFQVTAAESPYPFLRTAVREAAAGERSAKGKGRQWRVDLTLERNAPVGPLTRPVILRTNHSRESWLPLSVSGMVRPAFAVTPPEGTYTPPLRLDQPVTSSFDVKSYATQPMVLQRAEASLSWVTCQLQPVQEGRHYKLVVTMDPAAPKGPFSGELLIHTPHPDEPLLRVPIRGVVE